MSSLSILPRTVLLTVKQISNRFIEGRILSDLIELNEKFDLTRDTIDDETEALKPKLSYMCSVVKMFPCPTPKHRFCQNEIPAYLIRSFFAPDPRIYSCDANWAREAAIAPGLRARGIAAYVERVLGRGSAEAAME
ncbi:uncharacterized protein LOC129779154 isoform X2 [Toxorhynchites rutilus septentrionalis]|uniref:uncharacterized protein LOC129779154 isoform X2 n=1 Tax=Toxorhynchites rutilus septentrionalis TaxID=329112 RepID=UPI00247AA03B|nr:uncharacterized protein LOC129779154 isoform X2 [Toxorhynchites rutilus septentrionalis]